MTISSTSAMHYRGRVIDVSVDTLRRADGTALELEMVHHPGGAAAVAVDADDRVCLVRQYRHAAGDWLLELPAGKLDAGEPPLATARRELLEETGLQAQRWQSLGRIISSPGVFTEWIHLFLARGLTHHAPAPDADEQIEVQWLPFEEALEQARDGRLCDAKTLAGLLRAAAHLRPERAR